MSSDLESPPRGLPPADRSPGNRSPSELLSRRRWLALAVLCVTVLIANLDNTVLNVALPTLVRDLNATSSDLQWTVYAYILVFAFLLLAARSLAYRVGRKKTFLASLTVFAGGSAWPPFPVASAPSSPPGLAGRRQRND